MRRFFSTIGTALGVFLKKADMLLLALCVLATGFGIVVISSATAHIGAQRFVIVQTAALLLGIALYVLFTLIDIDIIAERREILLIFNILFIATLFIWGVEGNTGNRSWLAFSWLPFNIQPAEICKITFIIILAKTMSIYRNKVSSPLSVVQIGALLGIMVGLILVASSDAGVALPYIFVFIVMAYVGGVNLGWFLAAFAAVAAAFPVIWARFMQDYQKDRILMIFDPTIDPEGLDVRWHTKRSLLSLQGGGMTGQGLYQGSQTQTGALNAQHTDFIFSAIGEELGMIGCLFILLLLTAIVIRCITVGSKSGNYMNRLICIGIAGMLVFQIMVNVGMCMGIFPVIGLTLPFVSYGGSSIVTMFAAMGIVSGIRMRPAPDTTARYIRPNHAL